MADTCHVHSAIQLDSHRAGHAEHRVDVVSGEELHQGSGACGGWHAYSWVRRHVSAASARVGPHVTAQGHPTPCPLLQAKGLHRTIVYGRYRFREVATPRLAPASRLLLLPRDAVAVEQALDARRRMRSEPGAWGVGWRHPMPPHMKTNAEQCPAKGGSRG